MRYLFVLLMFSGCAAEPVADIDASKYEGSCARQCLASNSTCMSGSSTSLSTGMQGTQLAACNANAKQCLSTCPIKQ